MWQASPHEPAFASQHHTAGDCLYGHYQLTLTQSQQQARSFMLLFPACSSWISTAVADQFEDRSMFTYDLAVCVKKHRRGPDDGCGASAACDAGQFEIGHSIHQRSVFRCSPGTIGILIQ